MDGLAVQFKVLMGKVVKFELAEIVEWPKVMYNIYPI